jgi:hypothetical protein
MENVICTIATKTAEKDLKVFLYTLGLYNNPPPPVFILCDNYIKENMPKYIGNIESNNILEKYSGKNRQQMENTVGKNYKTEWEDFMMEKASVLKWAFSKGAKSTYFMDSDICFLGKLIHPPENVSLAVSQHEILPQKQALFGIYNAGYMWTSDSSIPEKWCEASKTSRYYDQAALEDLVKNTPVEKVFMIPTQCNYGWWRMYQNTEPYKTIQTKWALNRNGTIKSSGIYVNGSALLSIHTHWGEKKDNQTIMFNNFVLAKLKLLHKYDSTGKLLKFIQKEFNLS